MTDPDVNNDDQSVPRQRRSRLRRWVVRGVAAAGVIVVAVVSVIVYLYASANIDTVGTQAFTNQVHIPPLDEGRIENGRRVFDLDFAPAVHDFGTGRPTDIWGVNGAYLGPTLRAERGESVTVNVTNSLDEDTTTHWHGMHLPAVADGGPHQPIEPGDTWSPEWDIDQPAATLWYHPHPHERTSEQIYRGLAGMFLIDDPHNQPAGLPHDYGIDDIPVIVQDKNFDDDGSLDFGTSMISPTGFLGDTIAINGTIDPYFEVTTDKVRLRILNASNARIYNLGLDGDRPFQLVGTDGGLLPRPVELDRVQISPGDRVEIVIDIDAGKRLALRSYEPELGAGVWNDRFTGGDDQFDLLELRATDTITTSEPLPQQLDTESSPDPSAAVAERVMVLTSSSTIDNKSMDMSRVDHTVAVDTSEIWTISNQGGIPHNFHIHDTQFQVLELDGAPPPPALTGRHDTVYMPPDSTVRLLVEFSDYADADTPYMYHCHITQHEDRGMMGQFTVTEAGTPPATSVPDHRSHP